jgi:hypothetical protein
MKLQIKGTTEAFNVERGIGLALLAIAPDKIQPYVEPVAPQTQTVQWQLFGGQEDSDQVPAVKAECPQCHQGTVLYAFVPFKHCRTRCDLPPNEMAEKFKKLLATHKPRTRKLQTPPTNDGKVAFIGGEF